MASLFALGVMSITWMAVVSALIAAEKTLPWRRPVTYATALVLVALALMLVLVPGSLPGLTIPGSGGMMGMAP
jgi:predicted metal-binding membrane protein